MLPTFSMLAKLHFFQTGSAFQKSLGAKAGKQGCCPQLKTKPPLTKQKCLLILRYSL